MANTVIALKKSATPSAVPSSLEFGELAINYADGKIFYKAANGSIYSISDGSTFGFSTVNANNTLVVADTPSDIFSLVPGNNISIVGDAINDAITVGLKDDISIPGNVIVSGSEGIRIFGSNTAFYYDSISTGGLALTHTNDVNGNYFKLETDDGAPQLRIATSGNNIILLPGQFLGVGTTTPQHKLDVLGSANVTTAITVAGMNVVPAVVAAFDKANSANVLAFDTGIGANAYASGVGSNANLFASGVGSNANLFASATIAGANTAVGAGANSFATVATVAANNYAGVMANAANAFMISTISGANSAVGAGANSVGSAAFAKANANNGIGNSSSGEILFNDSGVSNGSSNLTFNKTTGTLNVVNINITGTASYISANSITIGDSEVNSIILITSTTNDQIIDSFANTSWRSAHYHVTMNAGTDYQTTQISLLHDGFTAYMTEYAALANANTLGIFSAVVTSGSVRLNIVPTFAATTIRMFRTTNR